MSLIHAISDMVWAVAAADSAKAIAAIANAIFRMDEIFRADEKLVWVTESLPL